MLLLLSSNTARADNPPPTTSPTTSPANDDANREIVLPTGPGDHKLKFRTHIGDRFVEMPYLLHLPADYAEPGKKHPMLVFFHGAGECGTDLAGVYALGPMTWLKAQGGNPTFAASCPFIVLCPQCPPGRTWDNGDISKASAQLVDQTIQKTRTDPNRVCTTGLSMGGLGSWCVTEERPDLFAAVGPLSAMKWKPEEAGRLLNYVSAWCVVGVDDQPRFFDSTQQMQAALKNSEMPRRFTYLHHTGHEAFMYAYQSPQFYEWLLEQRRPDAEQRKKLDTQPMPPATQTLPAKPGHYLLNFQAKIGDQPVDMDCVLYLPKGYTPTGPARPAMLFLHEQDTIGPAFHNICMHGPDLALERNPALQHNFPFVIISPRLPIKCNWENPGMTGALLDLLDHVGKTINIDPARVSVTGINAGASGAWNLATDAPGRFCAILPVVTDGNFTPRDDRTSVLNNLPGRVFVKSNDNQSLERMNQLIAKTKRDWQLTTLPENANAIGDLPVYSDRQVLDWLAKTKR
jgi:predicted peptidase